MLEHVSADVAASSTPPVREKGTIPEAQAGLWSRLSAALARATRRMGRRCGGEPTASGFVVRGAGPRVPLVYLDLTHLGRHVTGIERVTIEQFERVVFEGAEVRHVRSKGGILGMIVAQQVLLPLIALVRPRAQFVFPGFPPSPFFRLARERVVLYVHDLFLITRPQDLGQKAKLYMARPFGWAVRGLKHFLVNSEKTRAELLPFVRSDARIALYRPGVRNVFSLASGERATRPERPQPVKIVSLGTVEPRKNYRAAAAVVAALDRLLPGGAELHIAGREGWGNDAEILNGLPVVRLHGYLSLESARELIESADLYLTTSHDEGLGLPLLEVQYAGLPVVAPVRRSTMWNGGTPQRAATPCSPRPC